MGAADAEIDGPAELGRRLDLARRQRGLTYRDLERRTGMPRSTLHHLFHGRKNLPDYYVLVGLVSALGGRWDEDGWAELWRGAADSTAPIRPAPAAEPAHAGAPTPRQLPPGLDVFAGRTPSLTELDRTLTAETRRSVAAIVGPGGIGKTTLAVRWAREHLDAFPDGQLYADLGGFGPTDEAISAASVLSGFLGALGVGSDAIPPTLDEQTALYRSLLSERRMLILLDNVRDSEHALSLLPGAASCTVLVTSRGQLPTLVAQGAHVLSLELLTRDESAQLLTARLGTELVAADGRATDTVIERCAGLPLALAIVAARTAVRRDSSLAAVAEELHDTATRLDALDAGEVGTDLRAVLSWSYRRLEPDEARLLRLLAVAAVPDLSVDGIAALAGLGRASVSRALRRLLATHLVLETRPGRYGMHDLVRLVTTEYGEHDGASNSAEAATTRLLHWLLTTADAADRELAPNRRHALAEAAASFAGHDEALRWCAGERHLIPAAARLAQTPEQFQLVWPLPRALWSFYRLGSDWPGFLDIASTALSAGESLDDGEAIASACNSLGIAHATLGNLDRGADYIERALQRHRDVGDRYAERIALNNLGDVRRRAGELAKAVECLLAVLEISRELDDQYGECLAIGNLGLVRAELGEPAEAMSNLRDALALAEHIGDRDLEAETRTSIGDLHRAAGRVPQAVDAYQLAVDGAAVIGARTPHAKALTGLAEAALATGDRDAARGHAAEAQTVLGEIADAESAALADRIAAVVRDI